MQRYFYSNNFKWGEQEYSIQFNRETYQKNVMNFEPNMNWLDNYISLSSFKNELAHIFQP